MRLHHVIEADLCSGCGLCASIIGPGRARMALNEAGYLRPKVTDGPTPAEDALIDAVCPGGRLAQHEPPGSDPVWGPIEALHTGSAADERLRFKASSGGALSATVQHLVDTGQADYVLHVGANAEVPWLNEVGESASADGVAARAGSRYAPSAPLADIVQRLDRPERFVVVAKPCDIAGLRMYARQDPRVAEKVVAMVSFMCGGIPSERGVRELIARMGVPDRREVTAFRYRGNGWPGEATATLRDGSERRMSYADSWGGVLSRYVQVRCKICPDGEGRFADLVCADAWYGDERGYPSFEEQEGRSLVLARTATGAALVDRAARAGVLRLEPLEASELVKMQPYQARRTRLTLSRIAAMAVLGRRFPRYSGLRLPRAAAQAGLLANLKSFLGTARRVVLGRL